uniref:Variant surface glycoprotein n=1 Tax=Trypanosoma brucei TaxID=5691 RepID=A0A1V0FYB0_9TRYP|nr:variant surface glycoprotein [Trypanosoma brucei]
MHATKKTPVAFLATHKISGLVERHSTINVSHTIGAILAMLSTALIVYNTCAALPKKGSSFNTDITTPYHEKKFNDKLISTYTSLITGAEQSLKNLAADQRKLRLLACKVRDTKTKVALLTLSALTEATIKELHNEIGTKKPKLQTAVDVLTRRNAQLKALLAQQPTNPTMSEAKPETTKQAAMGGSSRGCTTTVTSKPVTDEACPKDDSVDSEIETAAANIGELKNYKVVSDSEFTLPKMKIKVGAIGTITNMEDPAEGGIGCTSNGGSGHNLARINNGLAILSLMKAGDSYTTIKNHIFGAPTDEVDCKPEETPDKKYIVSTKHVAHSICIAQQHLISTQARPVERKVSDLAGDAKVQDIAYLILTGKPTSTTKPADKQAVAESLFGKESKTADEKFVKPYESQKLDFGESESSGGKQISELSDSPDYEKALAICNYEETQATREKNRQNRRRRQKRQN